MSAVYSASRADTSTRVGQLFSLSWKLDEHRKEMLSSAYSQLESAMDNDYLEFENFLNEFYGRDLSNTSNQSLIQQAVDKAVENFVIKRTEGLQLTGDGKLIDPEQNAKYYHSSYITRPVLERKVKEIDNLLKTSPATLNKLHKDYPEINYKIKELASQLDEFIAEDPELKTASGGIRKTNKTGGIIDQIDSLYRLVYYINGKHLGPAYGTAFEKSLQAYNAFIKSTTNQKVDELVKEAFATRTSGETLVDRGELDNDIITSEDIVRLKDEKVSITAVDKKAGKMDVEFTLPSELPEYVALQGQVFRISAKSWLGFIDQHFGSTSLFNALTRSGGLDYTLAYGVTVGYYAPKEKLWSTVKAHEFAKACIVLDVLMGYSQKTGYADTLVIQDRTNPIRPIRVFSIAKLLQKLESKEFNSSSIIYDYSGLNIRGNTKIQWWLSKLISQMHSMKVSVTSGLLTESL